VARKGQGFDLAVNWAVRQTSSSTQIDVKEPKLQLELVGSEDAVFGKPSDWTIRVSNPGTGDAGNVKLALMSNTDELRNMQVGTIEAGATRILDLKLRPNEAGEGSLRAISVTDLGVQAEAAADFHVRRGKLQVGMEGSTLEFAGTQAVYCVRAANTGNADLENVQVRVSLPEAAKYVSGPEGATVSAGEVIWSVERISPQEESRIEFTCELCSRGDQHFTVQAQSADELVDSAAAVTQVRAIADLKLDVLDPKGPRAVAEEIEYQIVLTNRGSDKAEKIQLTAVCAPELETLDLTGSAAIESGQIFFRPIAQLESGQQITRTITVRANEPGSHTFRVVVRCDNPATRLSTEETTTFFVRPAAPQSAARASSDTETR
jgi:hypothetical protein